MKLNIDLIKTMKLQDKHLGIGLLVLFVLLFLLNLIMWPREKRETLAKVELKEVPRVPEEKVANESKPVLRVSGIEVISRPRNLSSIPPGAFFKAKLSSGASNGLVKAEVIEGLAINSEMLIPEGSSLVGQGTSSEERLFIQFNQVVFKDGTFSNFNAVACDNDDQMVGLKGSLVGNRIGRVAGGVGLGFLGGFSSGLQEPQGYGSPKPSMKNAILNGTATTALEESRKMLSDLKNRMPIMEVKAGTEICVIASGGS